MECKLQFAEMGWQPPGIRTLFSTLYPIPRTCLMFSPKTLHQQLPRPQLLSLRFCTSSSAALDVIEYNNPLTELENVKSPKFQLPDGFDKIPRSLKSPSLKLSVERGLNYRTKTGLDEEYGDGFVNWDMKEELKWFSKILGDCTKNKFYNEGKSIHGRLIRLGVVPDNHLWVSLINFYSKCGALYCASKAFDDMPDKDVVSWSVLIEGFVAKDHRKEAGELFCKMRRAGVRPNGFTLLSVVKSCSMSSNLELGKQLHAEVAKCGFFNDVYVGSALVKLYAECGEMEYAHKVFYAMPEQNAVSWNAFLSGYANAGDGNRVLTLFCTMTESDVRFSSHTLSTVLKGCASLGSLRAGQVVHSMAIKIGHELDDFISCGLVHLYTECDLWNDAVKMFKRIRDPDLVTWTTMISGLSQQGQKLEAIKLFHSMISSGLRPNEFSLSAIATAAPVLGDFRYCQSIHACVCKFGHDSEISVCNALINMYMGIGSVYDGSRVFSIMGETDIVSWNILLSGFHGNQTFDLSPSILKKMLEEGVEPDKPTFVSIMKSCASLSDICFGRQVHAHIIKGNLDSDNYIETKLIEMYAKCGCLENVEMIFNRMRERDTVTWTVLISLHAQIEQHGEKAMEYFKQMQREGVKANEFTLASCLKGCSGIASLGNGQQLHSWLIKSGHFSDLHVATALVDMYGKCGCIDHAETIFKSVDIVDTVLWNTMIHVYSQHGQNEQALQIFRTMLDEDGLPDGVTLINVLSACSRMGLVEEGKMIFHSMTELYGITPSFEHYACMIDLLGRAGRFSNLESFIADMKVTPNALIWQTVLGACKVHGNMELGERAAKKLFEIEPRTDSNYIALSNIYASKGRWDDVSRIRDLMSSQGVKKEPGCSWVELHAQTHMFLSQDASHPRIGDIYKKLEELHDKITSTGYSPNIDYVLHNVPERVKRENLFHHSERLALAFALLSNSPGRSIRIFKNLRICGDCHEFMKHVSSIIDQEIVIRDINYFHHFCDGMCSCKDYW